MATAGAMVCLLEAHLGQAFVSPSINVASAAHFRALRVAEGGLQGADHAAERRQDESAHVAAAPAVNEVSRVELPERDTSTEDRLNQEDEKKKQEFTVALGHCIDTLQEELPVLFERRPSLDIFTSDVVLKDPKGTLSRGRRMYGALFASLRLLSAVTGMHPRVTVHSIVYNEAQREVDVRLTFAFGAALTGEPVQLACMSHYKLDDAGLVFEQEFDSVIKRHLWEYSNSWATTLTRGAARVAGPCIFAGMEPDAVPAQQRQQQAAAAVPRDSLCH
ncbi:hypothetical protein JKP88DRAFT_264583 [Tribonema minus]|uniref:SnoaL-like domain-containing protein n=1 Tax=Tribonema minus TaxID=303371 RepID=A0A836CA49_9STRA|nr:hypothetical protein JKP88DRAFT_264583 [Tribonema minus]